MNGKFGSPASARQTIPEIYKFGKGNIEKRNIDI